MDPKELRANAPLSISVNDDTTKYIHSSSTLSTNQSKSYEIGSTAMGKVDATSGRPCAIIGPDRVLPQNSGDIYLKKTPVESWPGVENTYRQPPDYSNRLSDYPPIRNISPRQTFQENMQRIMVPPTYSSIKNSDDSNLKITKLNMPQEAKYCDVPYNMNSMTNELKSVKNSDLPMSSVNPAFSRSIPQYGWPASVNIRPPRPYGAPEIYQYPEYPSCVGPRPVTISHPHRIQHEEAAQVYSERLYQEANIRFKPYPILKEKHQQTRYDYINNYQNNFHPPVPFPPHKYDLQKSLQTHPCPMYPQVPLKYLDRRLHETFVDGYQRSNQQPNFNPQFQNQVIHPPYGPISGNCVSNKSFTDSSAKSMTPNKLPYETNNKIYLELEARNKGYPMPENVYYNDTSHTSHLRGEILLPNRSTLNMHSVPQHHIYRRENLPLKHYEYNHHYRNLDPSLNLNYSLPRLPLQYSPNTVAISPSDSNTSNDTIHTLGTSQEDCGYVSQSSTNSVRSLDAVNVSALKDMYRRHDYNIHALNRKVNSSDKVLKNKSNSSSKKNIDVRQFLQMWNEGEDEGNESNKEIVTQIHPSNFSVPSKTIDNQEQLYVLGLVNVPNEELGKYEHIQKISKLPENIKGYNSIELLNQYEELLESPNNNNSKVIPKVHKDHNSLPKRLNDKENNTLPRPVSPLDVEAKISQSIIHKDVGCNFEIKPCSPEMLNAEVATPIQNILGERIIEKVVNPMTSKSSILIRNDGSKIPNSDMNNIKIASCDIINKQYPINNYAKITKTNNYNVHDFESNSGVSLASLPRLDNDIELNFPEINQQFIKANKIESETHLFQKDLVNINLDQVTHENNGYQQNKRSSSPKCSLVSPPEKEFSKLSKYRKSKKCDIIPKEDILEKNTVQQRINSVIIKNPDTKLQEESDVSYLTSNKASCVNIESNENLPSITPENGDDNISFDTAIDFSLNKNEPVKLYNCLIDNNDKARGFYDSRDISLGSENVINKENIAKEQSVDLNLKQTMGETTKENVIINKELIKHSQSVVNDNNSLVNYNLPIYDLNREINVPVIKNLSILTEIEESANIQKSNTCAVRQEETSILNTSSILKTDIEMEDIDVIASVTRSNINKNISGDKSVAFVHDECKMETEKVNLENIVINHELEKFEENENDKSFNNSVISNKLNEVKEIPNAMELFIDNEKEITINTTVKTVETTLYDVMENKIDDKNIETSTESNKELELIEVLDKIEKNVEIHKEITSILTADLNTNETENVKKKLDQLHETKLFPSKNDLILNNQSKTSDDSNQFSEIVDPIIDDYNVKLCTQETNKIDADLSTSAFYNSNFDRKENNIIALQNSMIEISKRTEDENFDSEKVTSSENNIERLENFDREKVTSSENDIESLENNDSLTSYNENKNVVMLDTKFNLNETHQILTNKEKRINISKELYSPWIQKLIIFREGICPNVQTNVLDTGEEKLTTVDTTLRNSDKESNVDGKKINTYGDTSDEQNNLISSENHANEIQSYSDLIEPQKDSECKKNLPINYLSGFSEDYNYKKSFDDKNIEDNHTININCVSFMRRNVLKRSLSESALEDYKDDENIDFLAPSKRKKRNHNIVHPVISEDLCGIIQTNRRNSVSTFYNEDNVFILIDNDLIITEENNDTDKMYFTEIPHDFVNNNISPNDCTFDNTTTTVINEMNSVESDLICEEKTIDESWVEDVACIETVVSDDVTDDINYEVMSPKKYSLVDETVSDQSAIFCDNKHIDKIKDTYGSNMCSKDTQILQTLYMTPQMNVNKTLLDIESHSVRYQEYKETIDSPCEDNDDGHHDKFENEILSYASSEVINEKENINSDGTILTIKPSEELKNDIYVNSEYGQEKEKYTVHSNAFESSKDYIIESPKKDISNYLSSSSPEVSSTTPEEKNTSILLKITNINGSRISKVNEIESLDRLSYKLTEKKDYQTYSSNFSSSRTLITKAAQKYIPPLKESIRDLKIKLSLPQHRLNTLKQLKISKVEPKIDDNIIKYINKKLKQEIPKKPKPKFEDVLKSIDEIQFQKHRDKVKKGKSVIPKVVIKKNENGAHFASCKTTTDKETYNPDLTGRKWQPWVFIEKNNFIDKMAIKNKLKAVYCHRKNNYVLAENFRKYKSIYNANFVISQPSSGNSDKGTLKYTIKLKHK